MVGTDDNAGRDRDKRGSDPGTGSGGDGDRTRPDAFALLDERNDAATRKDAAAALGNPSSSMATSERVIADRLLRVALTDGDGAVRAEAIDSLYFHGDSYLDELVQRVATEIRHRETTDEREPEDLFARWLTSEFGEYRMVGATGLVSFGSERSIAVVRNAFDDSDPRVRARSVRAYAELGGETVEPIRGLLGTPNALVRRAAVDALVAIGTEDAVDLLSTAADAGDEGLRRLTVERLYGVDRRDAAATLLDSLDDPVPAVRYAAIVSLVRLLAEGEAVRGREIRQRLIPAATDQNETGSTAGGEPDDEHRDVRQLLAEVVTGDRSDRATAKARRCAAWLLGEFVVATRTDADESGPDDDTRDNGNRDDRHSTTENGAGASSEQEPAVSWLLDALDHPDRQTADIAAAYLPLVASPSVERALRECAEDSATRPDTKERARRVMRRIKRQTAASAVDRSIEYVYVRWPADYTEQHESRTIGSEEPSNGTKEVTDKSEDTPDSTDSIEDLRAEQSETD